MHVQRHIDMRLFGWRLHNIIYIYWLEFCVRKTAYRDPPQAATVDLYIQGDSLSMLTPFFL